MRSETGLVILVFASLWLSGCATTPKVTPHEINPTEIQQLQKGLLIGEVFGAIHYSKEVNLEINGIAYGATLKGNQISVALPPGNYSLDRMFGRSSAGSSTYDIKKPFDINPGEVTNLGLMYLLFDLQSRYSNEKKFRIFYLDNSYRANENLQRANPELYAALPNTKFRLEKGAVKGPKVLKALRREIAKRKLEFKLSGAKKGQYRLPYTDFTHGNLGTIAIYTINEKAELGSLSLLKTDILEPVNACHRRGGKIACWLKDTHKQTLLLLDKGKQSEVKLSTKINGQPKIFLFQKNGIVLVDNKQNIFISNTNGKKWATHKGPAFESGFHAEEHNYVRIQEGLKGIYIHFRKEKDEVLHVPLRTTRFQDFSLPPKSQNLSDFIETKRGYYAGPEQELFGKTNFYFRPHGQPQWQTLSTPTARCYDLVSRDKGIGLKLKLTCGMFAAIYESKDGGKSWIERE